VLFLVLVIVVAEIIDGVLGITVITPIVALLTLLPNIAIQIRRLHDLDRTGWWVLLHLIPIIGGIVLIIWFCSEVRSAGTGSALTACRLSAHRRDRIDRRACDIANK
jgi:uncharacterized membrane protein YhaH (DUF805 family)